MKLHVVTESDKNEARVALTPDLAKRYLDLGWKLSITAGAGKAAGYGDTLYKDAGVTISKDESKALAAADVVLHVGPLADAQVKALKKGAVTLGVTDAFNNQKGLEAVGKQGAEAVAMEFVPRITRAQSMDVLSSQANLAGYRAVIEAAQESSKIWPMMMTAAGTVAPARVFVMGAGVAGLQAIATAKRLGASVSATDVRPAAKEQVESLGAQFVMVEDDEASEAETSGGYAKEMSDAYKKKQAELIAKTIAKQDVVITTALIPGRPAPELVSEEMLKTMKSGAVIVDMAVAQGGNCPLSEKDKVVEKHGVKIVGWRNLPARAALESSKLYARNLFEYVKTMLVIEDGKLAIKREDQIWQESLVVSDGKIVHARLTGEAPKKASAKSKAKNSEAKNEAANEDAPKKKAPEKSVPEKKANGSK